MSACKLILASGSPQRRAILTQFGIEFEVRVSGVAEVEAGPPEEVVLENAFRKARAVAGHSGGDAVVGRWSDGSAVVGRSCGGEGAADGEGGPDGGGDVLVLGVDTAVALGGVLYGKPGDEDEARATLEALAGRAHRVLSGLCLIDGERVRSAVAVTDVVFRAINKGILDWYIDTGEWRGRAGGYAIQGQGAALIERIDGDYLNVVGLPLGALLELEPALLWAAELRK